MNNFINAQFAQKPQTHFIFEVLGHPGVNMVNKFKMDCEYMAENWYRLEIEEVYNYDVNYVNGMYLITIELNNDNVYYGDVKKWLNTFSIRRDVKIVKIVKSWLHPITID